MMAPRPPSTVGRRVHESCHQGGSPGPLFQVFYKFSSKILGSLPYTPTTRRLRFGARRRLMRKVTAGSFVSLDGVTESPQRWQPPYFNEEMGETVGAAVAAADTMLLGRVTYNEFASYCPGVSAEEQAFAGYMNNTPKHFVLRTMEEPSSGATRRL